MIMKKRLLFIFIVLPFTLLAQNPITQEATYRLSNEQEWIKVSTIDYDFQGTRLTKKTRRVYHNSLGDWYTASEEWFNSNNDPIRKITRSFISQTSGFFVRENQFNYSEAGRLTSTLSYRKENDNNPLILVRRTAIEYLDDCAYVERFYEPKNSNSTELVFNRLQLALYDKDCRFVRFVGSTNINESVEALKSQYRISYESLRNGGERRIIEEANCPTAVPCDLWDVKEQLTFDAAGRNILREVGSQNDFVRTLTTIEYEATRTLYSFRSFFKFNGINQVLTGIEEEIVDLKERPLYRVRAEPFLLEEWKFNYNENDRLAEEIYLNYNKSIEGIEIYSDTISTTYQFYCDGLPSEQIINDRGLQTRTTYTYLNPSDCGRIIASNNLSADYADLDFDIFPNPANDFIAITNEELAQENTLLRIMDTYGHIVQTQQSQGLSQQVIATNQLPNGTYFLQLTNQEKVVTKSFIIAR